jgi:hypothetical protein
MAHSYTAGVRVLFEAWFIDKYATENFGQPRGSDKDGSGDNDMDAQYKHLTSLIALVVAGCSSAPTRTAGGPGCVLEPELLQRCDPPALPTVQTFEQIDVAVTEAYVCTNQLNAQLAEILRRCSASGPELRQALVLNSDRPHKELDP